MRRVSLLLAIALSVAVQPAIAEGEINHTIDRCLTDAGHEVHVENTPAFQFRLQADGRAADIDLVVPSGDDAFDRKATVCMRDLRVDGKTPGANWVGFISLMTMPGRLAHYSGFWLIPPPPPGQPVRPLALGIMNCPPKVTPDAWRDRPARKTALAFRVTVDGTVVDPKVVESSGNREVDDAALACIGTWRFRPAMLDGKPVEVPFDIALTWYKP